ncbi:transposase [Amylibacter marinus]|uniref:transposase n=1 Tax=Amylibacter marinus TaxID=1475483 RepID=UPI0024E10D81|nr:transposase [Amylibacter marinus]
MRTRTGPNGSADRHIKEIKHKTRRKFSAEEKIRIVLDGLRGESSISELCRREGIAQSLYCNWPNPSSRGVGSLDPTPRRPIANFIKDHS